MSVEFDWVQARSECSPAKAFERLRLQVEQDIEARKSQRPTGSLYGFTLTTEGPAFTVHLEGNAVLKKSITFRQTETGVKASNETDKVIFDAKLTINDQGQCRFRVDGAEKDFWQVRHMALEDLFFGDIFRKS